MNDSNNSNNKKTPNEHDSTEIGEGRNEAKNSSK